MILEKLYMSGYLQATLCLRNLFPLRNLGEKPGLFLRCPMQMSFSFEKLNDKLWKPWKGSSWKNDLLRYSHQSFYIVGPSRQSSEENMWTPSFSKVELEKVLSSQTWSFVFSYMLYGTSVKSQGIWVNNFKIFLPLTVKKDKHSFAAVLESSKFTLNFAAKNN